MPDFPPSPAIGQRIQLADGAAWVWDGIKWTHPDAYTVPPIPPKITAIVAGNGLEGGGSQGDVVLRLMTPVPIEMGGTGAGNVTAALLNLGGPFMYTRGITDGSRPEAGEIGEYLELTRSANLTQGTGNSLPIGMVNLPPGDWDLWGEAEFKTGDNSLQYAAVTLGSSRATGGTAAPQSSVIFAVPAARVLGGATSNITILASWRFTEPFMPSGLPQVLVTTRARRMR